MGMQCIRLAACTASHSELRLEPINCSFRGSLVQANSAQRPHSPVHACAGPTPEVAAPMATGALGARVQEAPYSPSPRLSFLFWMVQLGVYG